MIFDHGCDAFNSYLNAVAIAKLCCVSQFFQALAVVMVCSAFFMATLEQYFTHYFYLPKINAVNEGILFLVFLSTVGGIYGRLN